MGTKPVASVRSRPNADPPEPADPRRRRRSVRLVAAALIAAAIVVAGGYVLLGGSAAWRAARAVRGAFASRRLDQAREPLRRWLAASPRSAEAHYYLARLYL